MRNIVIIGASGHGSVVLDCLERENKYNVLGFLDTFKKKGTALNGYKILGTELYLPYLIEQHDLHGAILGIGNNWIRKNMVERIREIVPDLNYVSTIHPGALIGKNVRIGRGSVIMPGAIVNANSCIGDFCILNTNSSLDHDGKMENFSSIAPGVYIGGNFKLGQFSAISIGANIIENITIGEHSIVGAASLVCKDVGSYSVVYGLPARFIRKRSPSDPYLHGDRVGSLHP